VGIISGRVLDEDGEPLPWAQVSALREVYFRGKRKLSLEALVPTNDLGEYRLFGLKPGRYFVGAWEDPDFLRTFEDRGQKISVEDADAKTANIVAIRAKSSE
jgi:hypothetical protein